jgi:hypothetical protein
MFSRMFTRKAKVLIISVALLLNGGLMLAPSVAGAASFTGDACAGVNALDGTAGSACSKTSSSALSRIIRVVLNVLSVIVGVAAVIVVILGGFKFITSNGDSAGIAAARNTILYAVVGLVIVASAQVIVHFVLSSSTTAITNSAKKK